MSSHSTTPEPSSAGADSKLLAPVLVDAAVVDNLNEGAPEAKQNLALVLYNPQFPAVREEERTLAVDSESVLTDSSLRDSESIIAGGSGSGNLAPTVTRTDLQSDRRRPRAS
ncbi:unnamed protein product [Peniophora sp. CBMAI 1063]|nr:unnamed protein product [Peniophora sp. CBMAI 1063]